MRTTALQFVRDDGGRSTSGVLPAFGDVGDCVARSIAIASGRPYLEIWERLALGLAAQRRTKRMHPAHYGMRSSDHGVYTKRKWLRDYMHGLGFEWIPAMRVGQGRRIYLRAGDLPITGRLVVEVPGHCTAVIDGTIRDTYDPSQGGKCSVRGFWIFKGALPGAASSPAKTTKRAAPNREPLKWAKPSLGEKLLMTLAWILLLGGLLVQFALSSAGH